RRRQHRAVREADDPPRDPPAGAPPPPPPLPNHHPPPQGLAPAQNHAPPPPAAPAPLERFRYHPAPPIRRGEGGAETRRPGGAGEAAAVRGRLRRQAPRGDRDGAGAGTESAAAG